ncbi:MAG: hypothetical protein DI529_00380 [Chryseobacterium sp.]|nr:MAG: hypothetical protein DI529_00380 [Chryseobacterium sp.]
MKTKSILVGAIALGSFTMTSAKTFSSLGTGNHLRTSLTNSSSEKLTYDSTCGAGTHGGGNAADAKTKDAKCGDKKTSGKAKDGTCGDKKAKGKTKDGKCGDGKCGDKKTKKVKKATAAK